MFISLGWMDPESHQLLHTSILADWASLNSTVTAPLLTQGPVCVEKTLAKIEQHHNPE